VTVTGTMMYMKGEQSRRFVPQEMRIGEHAAHAGAAQMKPVKVHVPQPQKVSGKIVDKEKMNAKETKVDHQLMLVEVDPQTRVLVDLGPSDKIKSMDLDEGDKVQVEGQQTQINERGMLVADKVQAKGKSVKIQHAAAPMPTPAAKPPTMAPPAAPGQAPAQPPRQAYP